MNILHTLACIYVPAIIGVILWCLCKIRNHKGAKVVPFKSYPPPCGYCGGISERFNGESFIKCDECEGTGICLDDTEKFYHD